MYKDTIKQGMEYQVYSGFVPVVDVYLAKKNENRDFPIICSAIV